MPKSTLNRDNLVPSEESGDEHREWLINSGLLQPGQGGSGSILEDAPLDLPTSLSEALEEDRTDRLGGVGSTFRLNRPNDTPLGG